MSLQPHKVKFTYEDYLLFPEDGKRHELIDGEHYMTPSPNTRHQNISLNLLLAIGIYLKDHAVGEIFNAPYDVVFSPFDVVQPDLVFVSSARLSIITEKNVQGVPDLVIEIISENTRKTDEVIKQKLYERHGVQEYWIVDPEHAQRAQSPPVKAGLASEYQKDVFLHSGRRIPACEGRVLQLETVKVYRMTGTGYSRTLELAREADHTLTTPLLPDLEIPLAEIFG